MPKKQPTPTTHFSLRLHSARFASRVQKFSWETKVRQAKLDLVIFFLSPSMMQRARHFCRNEAGSYVLAHKKYADGFPEADPIGECLVEVSQTTLRDFLDGLEIWQRKVLRVCVCHRSRMKKSGYKAFGGDLFHEPKHDVLQRILNTTRRFCRILIWYLM